MNKVRLYLIPIVILLAAITPLVGFTEETTNPGGAATIQPNSLDLPTGTSDDLPSLLVGYFKWIISAAIILAVLMIAIGGVEYILSAVPGKKEEGKNRMKNAVLGLLLALAAWLILKTINPDLVLLKFPTLD